MKNRTKRLLSSLMAKAQPRMRIKQRLALLVAFAVVFGLFTALPQTAGAGGVEPMIAGGYNHSLALDSDGMVWAWGSNSYGQLGNGSTENSSTPVLVTELSGIIAVAAGLGHSLALKSDGTVWAWGHNFHGQLGDSSTENRSTPVQVVGLIDIIAISAGTNHSIALRRGGTVVTWGYNGAGELGIGSTDSSSTPVAVYSGLSGIRAVGAGTSYSIALRVDGLVFAWGLNEYGQLGIGSFTRSTTPVQLGLVGITAIEAGFWHCLACKDDDTVWAWGYNENGQLGNDSTVSSNIPVQVDRLREVTSFASGGEHSLALQSDGTFFAWGLNDYGQHGSGNYLSSNIPLSVWYLSGVTEVAAGNGHSLAINADGTVLAWGRNSEGQLGDGTTNNSSTPVQVLGMGGVGYLNLYGGPPPLTLPVICRIGTKDYVSLETALAEAASGDTITLLEDIDYDSKVDVIGKTIIFDLNGKTLNIGRAGDRGLYVENGEVRLQNAANGELNVNGHGVYAIDGSRAEVHNITMTSGGWDSGAFAGEDSEVFVHGNITVTVSSDTNSGASVALGGRVTIEGTITVPPGSAYVRIGAAIIRQEDGVSRDGYIEYGFDINIVRVKDTRVRTVTVGAQSGALKPGEAGTVTFPVTTAGIDNGKTGAVSWFTSAAGTTAGAAPSGIAAAVSNVASNAATVTMTATNAAVAGTYYFKVTIDGQSSAVATLTVSAKTVTVGAQVGALKPGESGTVTFPVATAGIDNGKTGAVSWFTTAAGTTAGAAPSGIAAAVSNVASNAATVTMTATNAAVAGTYYFKVTIDGQTSAVCTLTIAASAAGMRNFVKVNAYVRGYFPDVNETAWYGFDDQKVIALAYEYGLMQGNPNGTFDPQGNVTLAHALAVACRVHSIYETGDGEFTQGPVWFQVYVDYAIEKGIITANDFAIGGASPDYSRPATRAEMVYIFSRALPKEEFAKQNTVNSLPDVHNNTPYYESIIMLYEAGVLTGNDERGTFYAGSFITRAEASAIISRVILPAAREKDRTYGT